jgi:type IV secretory pathway VirB10-like protein
MIARGRSAPLVSPRPYQTPGGVPRSLLIGIAGMLAGVALVVTWLTGDDRPTPRTADARAREQLQKAETVRAQSRGSARAVDEAAEHAEQASQRSALREAPRASEEPGRGPVATAATGAPLPSDAVVASRPAAKGAFEDDEDPGRAAREMDARSAEVRIFDASNDERHGHSAMPGADPDRAPGGEAPTGGASATLPAPQAALPVADTGAGLGHVVAELRRLAPPGAQDAAQRSESWQAGAATAIDTAALVPRPARGQLVIDEGTVIPAVLTRRISTDAPGVVTALVSMDVYDSRTARALLLPKGARLVGRYNGDVAAGQSRVQFAFTRLILPDGASFDLPGVVGSDAAGQGGLEADVDRHFLRTFGAALAVGVLADHVVRPEAVPPPGFAGSGLSATGQVLVDTANAVLQRNAAIVPTLTIGEGARLNVEVVRDMVFPHAYRRPS